MMSAFGFKINKKQNLADDMNVLREMTDEELVSKTLKNSQAYTILVERYEEKLLRYIMRISVNTREDAEDVLQDVFLSAYKNLNDFDQDLKFSSWIYRIAHNKVISYFRKVTARPKTMTYEGDSRLIDILASEENVERNLEKQYTAQQVAEVLEKMDKRYKEVLVLKFLEEKDYKEISDILEKPMGTVATLISRAKKQFREKLKKIEEKRK